MNNKKLFPIPQRDPFGCGISCVAVATNLSYNKAKSLFLDKFLAKTKGYFCKDLIYALKQKGLSYKLKKYNCFRGEIEDGDIVFIRRDKNYPYGHYLIKKGAYWVDSWTNLPKLPVKAGLRRSLPGTPQYLIKRVD
jgi:hypothetical protein